MTAPAPPPPGRGLGVVVLALLGAGVLLRAVVGPVGLVPLLGVPPAVVLAVGHTRLSRGRCPPTAVLADLFHPR